MALDITSWNVDYPLEIPQPIASINDDTFPSLTLPTDPSNETTTAPSSICPTSRPLFGMPPAVQEGVSLGEARALHTSPLLNFSPTFSVNSTIVQRMHSCLLACES